MDKKKYYITTAIAYASSKPHIGNVYEIILSDAIARFKRAEGYDVFFMTGSDEHGQKIEEKAKASGKEPKQYVDDVVSVIKENWDLVNISYDKFMRTTDDDHRKVVQHIFKRFFEQGDIYKGCYEGMYCTACESFFRENQLLEGRCPDCGGEVFMAKEEAYFFNMAKYADKLIAYINEHPDFIQPVSRKNEMMNNFLLPGLQDLCVSRTSFNWGIPVDFDPKHVTYVWLDALANYISGIGYDIDGGSEKFKKLWPADVHVVGKDIVRFHTIYWPIFLMALGIELPKQVFGHPWLLQGDGKMSKSKGNVLYTEDLVEVFGVDVVRYLVLNEMPFDNDGVISWDLMFERFNSELANVLGNLVSRTISMSNKYFDGEVSYLAGERTEEEKLFDDDLRKTVMDTVITVKEKMDEFRISEALHSLWNIFRRCNKYIDETTPWILAKDEARRARLADVLYNLSESIIIAGSLLESFMPATSLKILEQFRADKRDIASMDSFGRLDRTRVVEKAEILFARLDAEEFSKKVEELMLKKQAVAASTLPKDAGSVSASGEAAAAVPDIEPKAEIEYDDFDKLQIQVGEVLECVEVKKSKKLLLFKIKIGSETRQILSGIKQWYKPEELLGKKVVVLVNLKPRKIAGYESEGMILSAEDAEGNLSLLALDRDVHSGSVIG